MILNRGENRKVCKIEIGIAVPRSFRVWRGLFYAPLKKWSTEYLFDFLENN